MATSYMRLQIRMPRTCLHSVMCVFSRPYLVFIRGLLKEKQAELFAYDGGGGHKERRMVTTF